MARKSSLAALVAASALIATVAGCAAGPSTTTDVAASCNAARTGLTAMVSLLDSPDIAYDEREDQPLDVTTAADITDGAKALGEKLGTGEVGAAYGSVEKALVGYAQTISADGNSAADIVSARRGVDTAAGDLIALCSANTTAPSVSAAKVATSTTARTPIRGENWEGDNTTDLIPAIEVGEVRSGTMFDSADGREGTWTVRLERVEASVNPLTWGRDYVIRLHTDLPGVYQFWDGNGERYSLSAAFTPCDRSLYYNSDEPRLTAINLVTT